ncbi:uncharacterized protein LOC126313397 [Schistocerca gregaria]|uniref:uncharacterized protein LOC126313397 n=1 Tax=Schistocerca gregaria TaxID=7010 RepID=UPI00211E4FA5|nr:uncharacterized protein LOC126313397 [Schistocerca gregaria]
MSKKIPRQKKRRKRESYNERPRTSDLDEDLPKKKYSVEPPREPSPPVSKKRHLEKPAHPTDVPLKKTATSSSSHQPPPSPRDNPPATQTPGPSPLPDDHPPAKKTPPSSKALDLERSQQQSLLKSARDPNPPQGRAPLSAKSTSAQLSFNKFHAAPGDYELEEDRYIDILFKHAEIQKEGKKPNAKHITPLTKDPTKPECTTNSATLEPILPTSIPPSKNNDQTPFTLNSPNPSGRVTENPSPLLLSRPNNAEPWKLDAHEPPIANSTVVNPFKQPPASTLNSTAFSAPTDSANRLEVPFGHRDSVQFPKLPNFSHNPLLPSPQPPNPTSSIAVQPPSNSQFNIRLDGTPVQSPFGITANTNSGHLKLNAPS